MTTPLLPARIKSFVARAAEFGIALLLFWSGFQHLKNPFAFLTSVLRYRIVSGQAAEIVATLLPVIQTVLAAAIAIGLQRKLTLALAGGLFAFFSAVQISALLRGLEINCGCFGVANDSPIDFLSVVRVSLLAIVSWLLLRRQAEQTSSIGNSAGAVSSGTILNPQPRQQEP